MFSRAQSRAAPNANSGFKVKLESAMLAQDQCHSKTQQNSNETSFFNLGHPSMAMDILCMMDAV